VRIEAMPQAAPPDRSKNTLHNLNLAIFFLLLP
jgi:hypothetical protein